MRPHAHWHSRGWGVPPFGLRRRIFWSLVGAMIMAGLLTAASSALWTRVAAPAGLPLVGAGLCVVVSLWLASGRLAYRLVRPLNRLVDMVERFGKGDLSARSGFPAHRRDEVGRVAKAIDAMAGRIEHQVKEERQLLAVVSHELRTPMARIRVLTDLVRGGHAESLDDIDREVSEVDYLVSNILARSRLEFGNLARKPVDVVDAVREALSRSNVPEALLKVHGDGERQAVSADPTLLHRAIANLVDNAGRHGGGVTAVEVGANGAAVTVEVFDSGPGFDPAVPAEDRFRAFAPGKGEGRGSGLGLGLNLVERIIAAHGGRVWAENRAGGGARVGFELPVSEAGEDGRLRE